MDKWYLVHRNDRDIYFREFQTYQHLKKWFNNNYPACDLYNQDKDEYETEHLEFLREYNDTGDPNLFTMGVSGENLFIVIKGEIFTSFGFDKNFNEFRLFS